MEKLQAGARQLGLNLSAGQLERFQVYYQELVDWNRRINLTAITDYGEVQVKHFLDSLTVLPALPKGSLRVIDIGAGAGLPGLPLKIALPDIRLVLLDATAKKTDFLRQLIGKLGLSDVEIVTGRAEEVAHKPEYREHFDVALSRAVASLAVLVELALPFCTIGGSFVAQKKGAIEAELKQAEAAISLLGGRLREVRRIDLPELADDRYLVVIDKVSPAPDKYPRRPGIPNKRPLG